ncbi:reverse transcriptase domain-containing protein [Tanacetum coccineum]
MDQEKTTFTCPFGTYAYRRMPFGLCNAPATFQRYMLAIFHDMIEESIERCKYAHLVLNWEKCHFIVKEGIVLGHKTIKDFSKIARPLTKLLEKDTPFEFDNECQKAFESLKEKLTCALVIISPNWNLPFERMCDASDFAVGAVLGQKDGKNFHPIYFAGKTLNPAQQKYTVTEKELMVVVFAFDKFRSYLILSKTIVHTNHSALKNLFKKQDAKPLDDKFPRQTLMEINTKDEPWFTNFANYLIADIIPKGMTYQKKNKFFSDLKHYFWEEPYLFKVCYDGMIRRCVSGLETRTILDQCHHGPTDGHYGPNVTAKKILDSGFYLPTIIKEAHTLVRLCEACQKARNILKRDEMPLTNIQVCEIFNIWGIDFMGPFPKSHKFEYILFVVDYLSKWAKAHALPNNDARVVITFLKKLFCHFGKPKVDQRPRGQVKNTNSALKRILEKTVKENPAIWSRKFDDALWAFRIAYKTPTGTTPYKLIYGKNYHLPFEIEHCAYWALKNCNPDLIAAGEKRMFQLHELDNSRLYKSRTKVWHDRKLRMRKELKHRNKVMAISVILISSDSSEDSVGTPAGRVILFGTIPTTIPDTTDSDTPDTPPSPTYGTPFTEITASTQRSPIIPRRRVMILSPR